MTGTLEQIWTTGEAAAPMTRRATVQALTGLGLAGDRYALGGGTWREYPELEKQVTLIDIGAVAEVAAVLRAPFTPGDSRRNLVTSGIALPGLVGRYFTVGGALMFGMKRCPPCAHLERLTGLRLVKTMLSRGGINAAVVAGGQLGEGDTVEAVEDAVAALRGAPVGADRLVPRVVGRA